MLVSEIDDVALAPHGRREIAVCDDFTDSANIGYIVFESDSEDVVGYTKFYRDGYYRVAIPAVSDINAGDIYVTHIASDEAKGWGTGISLLNTTASAKTVTIEFDNGQTREVELAAHEHTAVLVRSFFDNQYQPGINSAVIRDADGVIGLEIFTNGVGYQMSGILLKDRTATTMYYPHTRNAGDWGTGIVAYNPSETKCDLTISPYTAAGVALPQADEEIAGGAHYIGLVSQLVDPSTAWLKIEAETAITGLELLAQGTNRLAGCSCVGITGTAGVFSKLERDGTTEIAFANTEDAAATVTLTAYNDAGDVIATEEIDLGAYAKRSGAPVDLFAGDITGATYIGYVSDRALAALQVNASFDDMMLDALPALAGPVGCTYDIEPKVANFEYGYGTGTVEVFAPSGCAWTAASSESNSDWIVITRGSSGSGNGTVDYTVTTNTCTSARTGTMIIAGETFTVHQARRPG